MTGMPEESGPLEILTSGREPSLPPAQRDSDPVEFEVFYRGHFPEVIALARALSWSGEGADDLAQEVMLRAYRDWGRIGNYHAPAAWVRRVCLNLALSRRRRLSNEVRAWSRWQDKPAATPSPVIGLDPIWEQVRALPRRQAEAVALFYVCDLSVAEVAATLGCSAGTVKVHLSRARNALAERLGSIEEATS